MSEKKEPRIIKRYANRKLYDMTESCYITHEEIASLVRNGEDVRIIDNKTKADLTSATLTQILVDEERRVKRTLPMDTLKTFFQQGGEFFQRHVKQPVANLRDEAEKRVREVFGKKPEHAESGSAPGPTTTTPALAPAPQPAQTPDASRGPKPVEALRDAVDQRLAEIQTFLSQYDFNKRIVELEKRIAQLESELAEARGEAKPADHDTPEPT